MTTFTKTYNVGSIKQLIDLNGDSINFDLTFSILSKNRVPFEMVIVDQNTLDNNAVLEYQKVNNGEINGQVTQDKNEYQNFFIVLRSEQPCECTVQVNKKELPKNIPQPKPQVQQPIFSQPIPQAPSKPIKKPFPWFTLIVFIALAFGAYYYYTNYYKTDDTGIKLENTNLGVVPIKLNMSAPSPLPSHLPSPRYASSRSVSAAENPIIARLKNLNVSD